MTLDELKTELKADWDEENMFWALNSPKRNEYFNNNFGSDFAKDEGDGRDYDGYFANRQICLFCEYNPKITLEQRQEIFWDCCY